MIFVTKLSILAIDVSIPVNIMKMMNTRNQAARSSSGIEVARGNAMNAKPTEFVCKAVVSSFLIKYPIAPHEMKPAKREKMKSIKQMIIASRITGFLISLYDP